MRRNKPIPSSPALPSADPGTIQRLKNRLPFPQFPTAPVRELIAQCSLLRARCRDHSDIEYLLMVGHYHLQDYQEVRRLYQSILTYRTFQPKAHWVAAQTEYCLFNYPTCLILLPLCLQSLPKSLHPRFLHLSAKCYEAEVDFIRSLSCYNQLLTLRTDIPELYLERGILYESLGEPEQAQLNYNTFTKKHPSPESYLKAIVIAEKNPFKKQRYVAVLAKLIY